MSPPTFPSSFLHAVDRWQKGGDRVAKAKRGERLKREVLALNDPVICECTRVVYRRLALPQSDIWKFITAGILRETISAWTVDDDIAKGVKGGIPEEWKAGKRWFGLVLQHEPRPDEVILNLETLWVDMAYQQALSSAGPTEYTEGIRRYENSQREVVLEVSRFSLREIWSWGGYSSSVEDLAELINGAPATKEQVEWLRAVFEKENIPVGARWTAPAGARNVTRRVLDHAREKGYPVPRDPAMLP
jgi:hypothetical protein